MQLDRYASQPTYIFQNSDVSDMHAAHVTDRDQALHVKLSSHADDL
jgi:hypothetical protein